MGLGWFMSEERRLFPLIFFNVLKGPVLHWHEWNNAVSKCTYYKNYVADVPQIIPSYWFTLKDNI